MKTKPKVYHDYQRRHYHHQQHQHYHRHYLAGNVNKLCSPVIYSNLLIDGN